MLHNHRGCLGVQVHLKIFCPPPCCPLASLWHSWLLHPTNTHVHCGRLPQCGNRHGLRARCRRSAEVQTRCAKDRPGNFRRLRHSRFPGARRRGLGNFRRTPTIQGLPTGCTDHISLLSKKNKNKCIWCKYAKMQKKNPKRKVVLIFFQYFMEFLPINTRSLYSFWLFPRFLVLIWFFKFHLSSSKLQWLYRNFSISNSHRL